MHMKNHLRSCIVLLLLLLPASADAQKVGSTSLQFLKVTPSARGSAVGDAYSTWAAGAEAVFWNPAGLAVADRNEVSFSYVQWIFDSRQSAVAAALPVEGFGVLGLQLQYVDYGEFIETSALRPYINKEFEPGITGRTFHPNAVLIGLSYATDLTDHFSLGGSAKYARESLYDVATIMTQVAQQKDEEVKTWAHGVFFDFGIRYRTGYRSVEIGASVQNFGANITYAKESNPIPMMFRWGAAADLIGADALFGQSDDQRVAMAFDLFQPNDYGQQEHLGAEYEYAKTFILRAGYKFNYDTESLTIGGGIRQDFSGYALQIDYSFNSIGEFLGNTHRFTLGVRL
jgi:hypothetical protein